MAPGLTSKSALIELVERRKEMIVLMWIGVAVAAYFAISFALFSWWSIQAMGIKEYLLDLRTSEGWSIAWVFSRRWPLIVFLVLLIMVSGYPFDE